MYTLRFGGGGVSTAALPYTTVCRASNVSASHNARRGFSSATTLATAANKRVHLNGVHSGVGAFAKKQQCAAFVTSGAPTPGAAVTTLLGSSSSLSSSRRLMSRCYAAGGVGVFNEDGDDEEGAMADGSTLDEWEGVEDDTADAAAATDVAADGEMEEEEDVDAAMAADDSTIDEWEGVDDDGTEAAAGDGDGDEDELAARAARIEAAKKRMEEEDKDPVTVLPGPVCDAFSALILELRAQGHGIVPNAGSSMDDGYDGGEEVTDADKSGDDDGGASIEKISSWSNPEPWSTFSGQTEWQVKSSLGDVRRTLKAYARVAPPGALNERLMGAVGAAWLETADKHMNEEEGKQCAFVWGGGEKFAILLNDTW